MRTPTDEKAIEVIDGLPPEASPQEIVAALRDAGLVLFEAPPPDSTVVRALTGGTP